MVLDEACSSSVTSFPPPQYFSLMSLSPPGGSGSTCFPRLKDLKSEERGLYLIHHLLLCANHVASGSIGDANLALECISLHASPDGDAMQRIAAYFTEALAHRVLKSWPGLHRALNSTKMTSVADQILARRLFFELCPFLKLSYLITNQAILEAMEGEKMVHIIDLCSSEPAQWINLLQSLRARPEGPPHLRITGIHEQKEILEQMAFRLTEEAERLDIPFQFNPVMCRLEDLDMESLRVKTGEALAISSVLQLHSLLAANDEVQRGNSPPSASKSSNTSTTANHLQRVMHMKQQRNLGEWMEKDLTLSSDSAAAPPPLSTLNAPPPKVGSFLTALWSLSPKLMMITEKETNQNGLCLMERVVEALNFYAAMFDCLESTTTRGSGERQRVEKMLLAEEINNIITCEGLERKERHEKLDRWSLRLELAGFGKVSLSYNCMLQAGRLLQSCGYDGYNVKEENGCFFLCWQDRPLFSVSAWRSRRYG
ncbi:hypothetical protein SAY87_015538 [Trapa incisa]|uniref:Scarecrow-like protein 3 n=1 Tax=Trapa incisa TaxID=236973 RepID=A0AAN7GXT5_9MYRT|nr:hypothetical protein SAY87_015538 [Trapa incisa]